MYYILISTPKTRILDPLPSPPFFEFPLLCFIGFFISILYRSRDTRFERNETALESRKGEDSAARVVDRWMNKRRAPSKGRGRRGKGGRGRAFDAREIDCSSFRFSGS